MKRRGFTLVELLVVIGIIVVLVGVLVPASMRAYRAGERAKTAADLQSISVGLEAFKNDWNDYPRPDASGSNSGFATLGQYLIGPYGNGLDDAQSTPTTPVIDPKDPPIYAGGTTYNVGDCVRQSNTVNAQTWVALQSTTSSPSAAGNPPAWVAVNANDGHDGPGIKRPIGGKVLGPYLQADKFKMRGLAILDRQGNPILYMPAAPGKTNIHVNGGYAGVTDLTVTPHIMPMYNLADIEIFFRAGPTGALESTNNNAVNQLKILLGDTDQSGDIGAGETEATTAPYILWSAGPDGIYGPARVGGTAPSSGSGFSSIDDVTNFR